MIPEYTDRELSGIVYVRSIPDTDAESIIEMIHERINAAERRSELTKKRVYQLKANFEYAISDTDEADETDECPPAV